MKLLFSIRIGPFNLNIWNPLNTPWMWKRVGSILFLGPITIFFGRP